MAATRHQKAFATTLLDYRGLRQWLLACAVLFPALGLSIALVMPEWRSARYVALYLAPLFAIAPLWVRIRLAENGGAHGYHEALDGLVLLLSFARFALGASVLPFSGHMLFLTYSGLTTRLRWYSAVVIVLLLETSWFKLLVWHDQKSWLLGLVLGAIAATAPRLLEGHVHGCCGSSQASRLRISTKETHVQEH